MVSIGLRTYARSVPGEFNLDKNRVLELAQQAGGFISKGALLLLLSVRVAALVVSLGMSVPCLH